MRIARTALAAATLMAVAAVAFAYGTAQADHEFPDVPTSHAFHTPIGEGAVARCYTGFDDGTFRPGANPTRGQFAYWLNNCTPRMGRNIAFGSATGPPQTSTDLTVTTTGADPQGTSHAIVEAAIRGTTAAAGSCPCRLQITLLRNGNQFESTNIEMLGNNNVVHGSLSDQLFLEAATEHDFSMRVERISGGATIDWFASMIVTTFPFGVDGGAAD